MRSRMNGTLTRKELQRLYQTALEEDLFFEDFGPKTTLARLSLILAVAACLMISLAASARLAELSPQGCYDALQHNLPVRAAVLEKRLVHAFGRWLSRRLRRRALHTMKNVAKTEVSFSVIVSSREYEHHRTKQRCRQKLLYAAWRVPGQPCEIRDHYRKRFGIEASYRQLESIRIRTCSRDPILRLFLVGLALLLRNIWVWLRQQVAKEHGAQAHARDLKPVTLKAVLQIIASIATLQLANAAEDDSQQRLAVPELAGLT